MFTRRLALWATILCILPLSLWAADQPALKSGPDVCKDLPGPFHAFNVTGKEAGNFHCVVCTNELEPVVLVFVRNSEFSKELAKFLGDLNAAIGADAKARISAAAIFLFDDLKNVVTDDVNRRKYAEKVETLSAAPAKLDHVILALDSADGPKDYGISPEAKVTVLITSRLRVVAKFVYTDEKAIDAAAIVAAVKEKIGTPAKK
jgi:hypothetical protein